MPKQRIPKCPHCNVDGVYKDKLHVEVLKDFDWQGEIYHCQNLDCNILFVVGDQFEPQDLATFEDLSASEGQKLIEQIPEVTH